MSKLGLRILQVSTYDRVGGAGNVAWNLFRSYRERGYQSKLAVGYKLGTDPDVLLIPNNLQRTGSPFGTRHPINKTSRLQAIFSALSEPGKAFDRYRGAEDFRYPATWQLMNLTSPPPDILHCHNLHGGYFDLRALPWLSQQVPVILTLHDAWLLSGHCAHSFECQRWKIGCGHCPDLAIEPPVRRDATAYNWRRKQAIYAHSRLYVSTPCEWLMKKVEQSMLAPAVVESRLIPNGVDLTIFRPADKSNIRPGLNIPQDSLVLLFVAYNVRSNMWKDYHLLRAGLTLVAHQLRGKKLLFIALGEDAPAEQIEHAELRFIPYQKDPRTVARYYQAADIVLHAAKVDTFPNTVLESLACGTPVVATAVGGIQEQIRDGRTGYLVPAGDPQAFAARILDLLMDDPSRHVMGMEAADDARQRFDLQLQVDRFIEWYQVLARGAKDALSISERFTLAAPR